MITVVLLLMIALAVANGANDVSKGVATLAGAGVVRYRTAIVWGTVTTLLGGILAIVAGKSMGKLFSSGIVSTTPTTTFAVAVLVGATAWVAFATVARLPISTTHAIVGSLIGAGLLFAPEAVNWGGLAKKVIMPLLLSVVVAYGISVLLALVVQVAGRAFRNRPADDAAPSGGDRPDDMDGDGQGLSAEMAGPATSAVATAAPTTTVDVMPVRPPSAGHRIIGGLHWASSGATCAARGLNDTPKIAAMGGFALVPAGMSANSVVLITAIAMTLGSLLGIRVARTLGERVVRMRHGEGFRANAVTATLVGLGGFMALPMTTTQVSTGAIAGSAGLSLGRLNLKTLRDLLIAWLVTPLFGGIVAALTFLVIR